MKNLNKNEKKLARKKKIINIFEIILIGIFLISLTSAIYAGECMEIDLSELDNSEDILYLVVGNSSNLDGMNITFNSTTKNASVYFAVNYKPDSFSLVFFNQDKEVIIEHHYSSSGGGGSRIKYIENKVIEYIEVPNYIDREVIIENKTDVIYIQEIEPKTNWFGIIVLLLLIIALSYIVFREVKKEKIE